MPEHRTFFLFFKSSNVGNEGRVFTEGKDIHVGSTILPWNFTLLGGELAKFTFSLNTMAKCRRKSLLIPRSAVYLRLKISKQCLSNYKVCTNHLAALLEMASSDSVSLGWGLKFCISNHFAMALEKALLKLQRTSGEIKQHIPRNHVIWSLKHHLLPFQCLSFLAQDLRNTSGASMVP